MARTLLANSTYWKRPDHFRRCDSVFFVDSQSIRVEGHALDRASEVL